MSYLVLLIMMKDGKSDVSPAGNLGRRLTRLEERVKALEETCMDKCKRKYTEKESFSILGAQFLQCPKLFSNKLKESLIYCNSRPKEFFNSIASRHFY